MIDVRGTRSSKTSIERLAKELASATDLSFDGRHSVSFVRRARDIVLRTRAAHRTLANGLSHPMEITRGTESFLDNFYIVVDSALVEIIQNWKDRRSLRLPQILDTEGARVPRVYVIARAFVRETNCSFDRDLVVGFLRAYQRVSPLSIRELDRFPDMIRFALIEEMLRLVEIAIADQKERVLADGWFDKVMRIGRKKDASGEMKKLIFALSERYAVIPLAFGFHLLHRLAQVGKEVDVRSVSKWIKLSLERQGVSLSRLSDMRVKQERSQTALIEHAISGLRYLSQVRWDRIAQELSMVDVVLLRDPSGAYQFVSEETRGAYLRAIVRIADRTGVHDVEVARTALRLAHAASEDPLSSFSSHHVGHTLVGEGVSLLEDTLGYTPSVSDRVRSFILERSTQVYFGTLAMFTLVVSALFFSMSDVFTLSLFPLFMLLWSGLLLSSEIATASAHFLFTRIVSPRPLPSLDLSSGIGEENRTFVVVPSMFRNAASAEKLLRRLETNYVGNSDPNIFYAVLMDFRDAPKEQMEGDEERVEEVARGIARLNERYPSDIPRFSLFYRTRVWDASEGVFMGWERKRGKLREFNMLLRGEETGYAGDASVMIRRFGRVRYVLTLDEDTELTRDSARILVGTIAHPLNRPVIDPTRRVVSSGYGIVQPRAAMRFSESGMSAFSRLFGGYPGLDLYSSVASDLHQDLFGEGIFHGKGIYDVDVIEETMRDRIPENTVLSHDLLEGLYARVGIAGGAHILEGFPSHYREHIGRLHRWTRGDWQIVSWAFGTRGEIFSSVGRYRIIDNLRRSLLPVGATIAVLFAIFSPANTSVWSAAVLLALGSGQLVSVILSIVEKMVRRHPLGIRGRFEAIALGIGVSSVKTFFLAAFTLHNAVISIDSITRGLWRLFVSKRRLLEWQTAYEAASSRKYGIITFVRSMWRSTCLSFLFVFILFAGSFVHDPLAIFWVTLWVFAPILALLVSIPKRSNPKLSAHDRLFLHKVAVRTYWFFLDLATKEQQWLAPDHLQEDPPSKQRSHGLGVSPTNLGMYLVSLASARQLGLSSIVEFADRIDRAFSTMRKIELYRGHFFNWYELKGLTPIHPRYVSSVDSANLALSLHAFSGATRDLLAAPVLGEGTLSGLLAQLSVLDESCERLLARRDVDRNERRLLGEVRSAARSARDLAEGARAKDITPRASEFVFGGAAHHVVHMRAALEALKLEAENERFEDLFLAVRHLEVSTSAYRESIGRFAGYAMIPAVAVVVGNMRMRPLYENFLSVVERIPSISELSDGMVREKIMRLRFPEAITLSDLSPEEKERATAWYDEVLLRLTASEEAARVTTATLESAAEEAHALAKGMDFSFLYNKERGLFHVGFNASSGVLDEGFYDLLASEANSASIVGIAKSDVPKKHWTYLGRKLVRSGRGDILVSSWAGSLFEYLGTLIYFSVPRDSFWGLSAIRAIAAHAHVGRRFRIPWGMAESASARRDADDNYHYQAFGEASLGFKRNLSESLVVAPYATALALPFAPKKAIANMVDLIEWGGFGRYGFYDAIDFTRRGRRGRMNGIPARIYYAHHQGFILSSIVNVLDEGWIRRMVSRDPEMESVSELFEEKMPKDVPVTSLNAVIGKVESEEHSSPFGPSGRRFLPWRERESVSRFIGAGDYALRVTAQGSGESRYRNILITRPCDDPLRETTGTFFFIRDEERTATWSPSFAPVRDAGERYSVSAGEQSVVYRMVRDGISSVLAVSALPSGDGEFRELVLENTTNEQHHLTLGVCSEIALSQEGAFVAHPAYEKLFVSTETARSGRVILATRADVTGDDRPLVAGFLLSGAEVVHDLRTVREKRIFYGSPEVLEDPPLLRDLSRADVTLPQFTLDSVAAFAGRVLLRPKEKIRIGIVIAVARTKEEVFAQLRPFERSGSLSRMVKDIDLAGGRFLQASGVNEAQAETFSTLASLALARRYYSHAGIRDEGDRQTHSEGEEGELSGKSLVKEPHPSGAWVTALWKLSISGVRPLITLRVMGIVDLPVVRQFIACHHYFVEKGIPIDLVIFNEHSGGYLKTFEDEIDFLINTQRVDDPSASSTLVHIRVEQVPPHERQLFLLASTLVVSAKKGSLSDAVSSLVRMPAVHYPGHERVHAAKVEHDCVVATTPVADLSLSNTFGGYDEKKREYVISVTPTSRPPRPWSNVVASPLAGFIATDRGMSFTWTRNSYDNRLTLPYNDPLASRTAESFFIRDEATGRYGSPLPVLGDTLASFEVRHGEGYTSYVSCIMGLRVVLTMFLAEHIPVKYFQLSITNLGGIPRDVTVFGYMELLIGSLLRETKKHFSVSADPRGVLVVKQEYRPLFPESRTFFGVLGGMDAFSASREEFLGRGADPRHPAALLRTTLSGELAPFGEPALSLAKRLHLAPGSETQTTFFLGECDEFELDRILAQCALRFTHDASVKSVPQTRFLLENFPRVELPDPSLSVLADQFLPYQTLASRFYARAGLSQIGGAYGFRDQLQDALALLWSDPALVHQHLISAARVQFREGDVLSWWQPHNNFGARTRLSDPQLWLPYVTMRYVRFTGDHAVLDETLPYLSGEIPDKFERQSVTGIFSVSEESGTLYDHLVRAVERTLTRGEHGLPLMGRADWNDGMSRVGEAGTGESVWLAWMLIVVLDEISQLAEERGDTDRAARFRAEAEHYRSAIESSAWDGRWYVRAFTDEGIPVGSGGAKAFRIDSVTQSWAYFANGANERTMEALRSAKEELRIFDGHVPLAWPPSTRATGNLGTISDYPQGVRENAAQYNHAALWLAQALFLSGDPDAGKIILDAVDPFARSADRKKAEVYEGEPYAVAAEVFSSPTYPGRAGWTWYTASSGLFYRVILESVLGLHRESDKLTITPSFPRDWGNATTSFVFGKTRYTIRYTRDAEVKTATLLSLDTISVSGMTAQLVDDGIPHDLLVTLPLLPRA